MIDPCGRLTMLKTAMTRMRAVVVMVSVMRGQGLLAMMLDDRSTQVHEADVLLLQCCGRQAGGAGEHVCAREHVCGRVNIQYIEMCEHTCCAHV